MIHIHFRLPRDRYQKDELQEAKERPIDSLQETDYGDPYDYEIGRSLAEFSRPGLRNNAGQSRMLGKGDLYRFEALCEAQ